MENQQKKTTAGGKRFRITKLKLRRLVENYFADNESVKSFAGLALHLGVDRETLESWIDKEEYGFCEILSLARTRIEKDVIDNGLRGKYNATMATFILKSAFGYRDKQDDARNSAPIRVEVTDELKKYAV